VEYIPDDLLVETYQKAIECHLSSDFILLLYDEILRRNIPLQPSI
jgi:hypothetical protein